MTTNKDISDATSQLQEQYPDKSAIDIHQRLETLVEEYQVDISQARTVIESNSDKLQQAKFDIEELLSEVPVNSTVALEVTVTDASEPSNPNAPQQDGWFADDTGDIRFAVWDNETMMLKGDKYRIENARLIYTDYHDARQISINERANIERIEGPS